MSMCQGCHAGCCRSFAIPTTGADILRIEREQKQEFWEFVCRWEDRNGTIAGKYAPHFYFADEPETPFTICLIQNESKIFAGTNKCKFLQETAPNSQSPLGTGNCGIYRSRPAACRVFPTKFDLNSELPVVYNIPENPREKEHKAYKLCHREWQPEDIDSLDAMACLSVAETEMKFFRQLAQIWNRMPAEWEVFPDFLRLVYNNRILREQAQPLIPEVEETEHEEPVILKMHDPDQGERRRRVA